MRRAIRRAIGVFARVFDPPGPIVELGSRYAPGYQALGDLRPFFPGREYVGCDIRPGPGVDRIEDAQALTLPSASAGTVLMFEALEHMPHPERAIEEARRVLAPDGLLALSVPFTYRLHGLPHDYRRLTAPGVAVWLAGFADAVVFAVGPRLKPAFVFGIASRERSAAFGEARTRFQAEVRSTFERSRARAYVSLLKERGRDLAGLLLGRAEVGVWFFDGSLEVRGD